MTRTVLKGSIMLAVLTGLLTLDAAAWGPHAIRAMTGTATQIERRTHSDAFRSKDISFEEDVLRGMIAGPGVINKGKPFATDSEAVAAVDSEIKLLREVRKFGVGSYFCYHMGVLGALAANLMLPFGLDYTADGAVIRAKIEADIDANLDKYSITLSQPDRQFVRSAKEYFARQRPYMIDNRRMIADDYRRGKGYDGFLKEGGEAFFCRATEAVADLWHTVLATDRSMDVVAPPQSVLSWYFVDEINYLLMEKKNFRQAVRAYDNFSQSGGNDPGAVDKLGDLFYTFGTDEAKERGVKEWRIAFNAAGASRREIGKKLADHYIRVGEVLLAKGSKPGATDEDLPNALNAFTQALEFDQSNEVAATRLNETNVAISERKERRQLNVNIIASAEKVMVQAEKSRIAGDFGNAITTYNQALGLFQAVDNEFTDQAETAKESVKEISKNITDVINQILDAASDAIDKGDKLVDEKKFEEAQKLYETVPGVVSVVPGDVNTTHGKDRESLVETSKNKIKDAKLAKQRYEKQKADQEEAAKRLATQGGPRPAAAPAAPATPAPAAPLAPISK